MQASAARNRLVVVGVGYTIGQDVPQSTLHQLHHADRVLYLLADGLAARWLLGQRPDAVDLGSCYREGEPRLRAYERMVERILSATAEGGRTVVVAYGHPGIFAQPTRWAIEEARSRGWSAEMLPAVSALDRLCADLLVDPGEHGCQEWEASLLLELEPPVVLDPRASLVAWQVGAIGRSDWSPAPWDMADGLRRLQVRLADVYGPTHLGCLYEASVTPAARHRADWVPLDHLEHAEVSGATTLWVPPRK